MPDNKIKLSTDEYKGVRDFYPEDKAIQNYIFGIWRKTMESFGYAEYDASILEPTEIYSAKSGEELVNEQTYTFIDRGDRSVTLRPEMTPTVARMVAKRRRDLPYPLRLYSIPNLFRYERPQKGRLREHWQLNADLFGVDGNQADVEIILLANETMKKFGLKENQYNILISSRKLLNAIFSEWYELDEEKGKKIKKLIDRKSKMTIEEFETKATEIVGGAFNFLSLQNVDEKYEEAMAMPMIRAAKEELDEVITRLNNLGVKNVKYDPELIRGFDYYTGTIFEIFDTNQDNRRSIMGGGRYDGLISLFGGDNISAVGMAIGDVTMKDVLDGYNLIPDSVKKSKTQIYICPIEETNLEECENMAIYMRENNINTAVHFTPRKLRDEIKQAEKQNIEWVLIIGENERLNKMYTLKNIVNGQEFKLTKEEIIQKINE